MLRPVLAVGLPALVLWSIAISIAFANPREIRSEFAEVEAQPPVPRDRGEAGAPALAPEPPARAADDVPRKSTAIPATVGSGRPETERVPERPAGLRRVRSGIR